MKRAERGVIKCVYLRSGGVGLFVGTDAQLLRRWGTDNVARIVKATQKDVDHVRKMGGYVPEGRIA